LLGHILWLQLGMVKPEIILCDNTVNISTLNTLTYLLTNIILDVTRQSFVNGVRRCVCSWNNQHPFHRLEPGVKVNDQYYREDLLMQKLLPDIRQLSDFYVYQQESARGS